MQHAKKLELTNYIFSNYLRIYFDRVVVVFLQSIQFPLGKVLQENFPHSQCVLQINITSLYHRFTLSSNNISFSRVTETIKIRQLKFLICK